MAIAEATEQMFPMVGDGAEFGKAEEATGAFDGMDCPEDTCQPVGIPRIGLECDEVTIKLVEILGRFDQEFTDEFVVVCHGRGGIQ